VSQSEYETAVAEFIRGKASPTQLGDPWPSTAALGAARTGLGGKNAQNEPGIQCQPKDEA
jgi:hypothetical protein